jgi:SAM-dependent methyltransferase
MSSRQLRCYHSAHLSDRRACHHNESLISALRRALSHPLTRDLDLDDPATTDLRRAILEEKPFLKQIYNEWYGLMAAHLPKGPGGVLELGSGAGFLKEFVSGLITSEVFPSSGVRIILDGQAMPFANGSLRGIAMTNVLHHVPSAHAFFQDASRCLRSGGRIIAIEPWVSTWSRLVYTKLHHEPFDPESRDWKFSGEGPLSAANGALPWIIFERDRERFEREFPDLRIEAIKAFMPFRYLICGGISMRNLMPASTFGLWRSIEGCFNPRRWAMFALIVIERR